MTNLETQEPEQPVPSAPAPGGSPDASPKRPKKKSKDWKALASTGTLLAFGVMVVILLYAFVYRNFIDPPVEPEVIHAGKAHVIQLDVLNGTGTAKLGQRFTNYLRARGFDVVEMGNYKDPDVQLTRVIDRAGNLQAAEQVAQALGVPKERVVQEIDRHAYLDVTVVIGKDFRSLKPMQ
ncbi:MAG: LytR C-terminal domain-containing protein [Bacteroidota bacterium]